MITRIIFWLLFLFLSVGGCALAYEFGNMEDRLSQLAESQIKLVSTLSVYQMAYLCEHGASPKKACGEKLKGN